MLGQWELSCSRLQPRSALSCLHTLYLLSPPPPGTSQGGCSLLLSIGAAEGLPLASPHGQDSLPSGYQAGMLLGSRGGPQHWGIMPPACRSLHLRSWRQYLKGSGCREPSPLIALQSPDRPHAPSWPRPSQGTHMLASGVSGRGMRR